MTTPTTTQPATSEPGPEWIPLVREKVERLRYGIVQLVIHDGRVTQIESTEKMRLPAARESAS